MSMKLFIPFHNLLLERNFYRVGNVYFTKISEVSSKKSKVKAKSKMQAASGLDFVFISIHSLGKKRAKD